MKKTKLTRSLLAACSIVALSAVMYGCTGPSQGDLDAANDATAAAAAEAKANADAAAAAQADAAAAALLQAEAEAKAEKERMAREQAEEDRMTAEENRMTAEEEAEDERILREQAVKDREKAEKDRMTAEKEAEDERILREQAEKDLMTAEEEEKKAEDDLAAKELAEENKKLGSLFKGLHKMVDNTASPPPAKVASDFTGVADPLIFAEHDDVSFILPPPAGTGVSPLIGSNAAFSTGTVTSLPALNGWTGTDELAVNAPADISDHINVYTDIDIGEETTFEMLFPQTTLNDAGNAILAPTALHFDEFTRVISDVGLQANEHLVTADDFQTGSGTKIHGNSLNNNTEQVVVIGSFAGASGVYHCEEVTINSCTSSGSLDGIQLSLGWSFRIDADEVATVPDGDYAYFGWWLRIDATGAWDVDVFHGSTNLDQATVGTALTGIATYSGSAAGKAVINPQLPGEDLVGGAFTADASLTANFQAGAATTGGMISGTIDNFMIDGEAVGWSVALEGTPINIAGALTAVTTDDDLFDFGATQTGVATARADVGRTTWSIDDKGSPGTNRGNWRGNFWDASAGVPGTVTGEFSAVYNNEVGRMEGAFGANKE